MLATAISNLFALISLYLINLNYGWRPDRGICLSAILPLVLLLPINLALALVLVFAWGGFKYHWLFNDWECSEIMQVGDSLRQRFGLRPSSIKPAA